MYILYSRPHARPESCVRRHVSLDGLGIWYFISLRGEEKTPREQNEKLKRRHVSPYTHEWRHVGFWGLICLIIVWWVTFPNNSRIWFTKARELNQKKIEFGSIIKKRKFVVLKWNNLNLWKIAIANNFIVNSYFQM